MVHSATANSTESNADAVIRSQDVLEGHPAKDRHTGATSDV
jgi:hypothetical protein